MATSEEQCWIRVVRENKRRDKLRKMVLIFLVLMFLSIVVQPIANITLEWRVGFLWVGIPSFFALLTAIALVLEIRTG